MLGVTFLPTHQPDDGSLSYESYYKVEAVKLINNFSNNKLYNPHGYKEEVKVKYNFVKAITEKFPNGTAAMMALLVAAAAPLIRLGCKLCANFWQQNARKERSDELNKATLYLINSKNKHAKKDLHLTYSQGNMTSYPPNVKAMDTYLLTQYRNNKSTNQCNGK